MSKSAISPYKIVSTKSILLKGLSHKIQLRHYYRVIHLESELSHFCHIVPAVLLRMLVVIVNNTPNLGSVPIFLYLGELFLDEYGVGVRTIFCCELL